MSQRSAIHVVASLLLVGVLSATPADASAIDLFDWGLNLDGTVSVTPGNPASLPGVDGALFDAVTGLGTIRITISGLGPHFFDAFFDHEIDAGTNSPFNEVGTVSGARAPGQSWEIDEPGFVNGDIFLNFEESLLDDAIGASVFGDTAFPNDVSMAIGWDFVLAPAEIATVSLLLSDVAPATGFYLRHMDPQSDASVYLSSDLRIRSAAVHGPGVGSAVGFALMMVALLRRRGS